MRAMPSFWQSRPRLSRWLDDFVQGPSMQATPLSGETQD
jgi:hypothetical protein